MRALRFIGIRGGGRRRRLRLGIILVSTALLGAFVVSNALAVHDLGLFQLDRNAQDPDPAALPDDWQTLYSGGANSGGSSQVFTGIVPDIATPGTQFQGGGSKDNNDLNQWLWKAGEPLDKDDITNAYAAGYVVPPGGGTGSNKPGDFIAYFGLDRFDNSGSAQVGFWFFKSQIGLTNTSSGGGFKFSGAHQVGDILVQSNFEQGGTIDNVSIYEWVGSGGSNGALNLIASAKDCNDPTNPSDDVACATVNQAATPSPWPYTPKSGASSAFPQGSFFEGGINITRLIPQAGCLSSFLAETRSSTPFDSRLKDFALGNFNTCRVDVDTNATPTGGSVVPGTSASDTATVTGSSLVGGTAPRPTGTVDFFLCQPSQVTAAGCPTGGTKVGATKTLVNGQGASDSTATSDSTTTTTAIGKYCWRAEYTPAAGSPYTAKSFTNATDECFTTVAQPTATTTRQFVFPQDKAKIAASAGGNLAGNVQFRLFDNQTDCLNDNGLGSATGLLFNETDPISGASPRTATTSNQTARVTDNTTVYWHVVYTSTNPAQLDSNSNCTESTQVTYAGNDNTINIP
jgi:hypothetical protein